jgi:transposase-like protein
MSNKTRKKYDASFKREAVRMADQSNKSDIQIENNLGISHGTIYRW